MAKSLDQSPEPRIHVAAELPKALDAIAVGIYDKTTAIPKGLAWVDERVAGALGNVLALGDFKGKAGSVVIVPGGKAIKRLMLVGLGKASAEKAAQIDAIRWAGAAAMKAARVNKLSSLAIVLPLGLEKEPSAQAVAEGAIIGSFQYKEFRAAKDDEKTSPVELWWIEPDAVARKVAQAGIDRGTIIGRATNLARMLACKPGNVINPVTLAAEARAIAKQNGLKIKVIEAAEAKRLGMGGLVGVGQASSTPPALIILEHMAGKKSAPTIAIVGKAVTFDSGGISIKPAADMDLMKYDKSGGMAVLGIMQALAQLKIPLNVVGIIPAAENAVSGTAYRPGDILRMYNGKTVEITNTDAEGRLILADAVAYAAEQYKPEVMIDMATLTGGCVIALGGFYAGLFSTDDALASDLFAAGQQSGEWVWRLPLHEKYKQMMEGHHADLINSAGREGSPITGASFIQFFVPEGVKWAHLDIAGTAFPKRDDRYIIKGASGFGVRIVLEYLRGRAM